MQATFYNQLCNLEVTITRNSDGQVIIETYSLNKDRTLEKYESYNSFQDEVEYHINEGWEQTD